MKNLMFEIEILIITGTAFLLWFLAKNKKKKRRQQRYIQRQNHYCFYSKKKYMTHTEMKYARAIQKAIPAPYRIFPQVCLASVITKNSDNPYQNELYRIIDFGIFDNEYNIIVLIEINDDSHHTPDRIERDAKVKEICAMANIPLITLWTQYGINEEYIQKRIKEYL